MKTRALFVLLLFVISQNKTSAESGPETLEYVSKSDGYRFRYPSEFKLSAKEETDSLLSLRSPTSHLLIDANVRVLKENGDWTKEREASHEQMQRPADWPAQRSISNVPAQLYSFREGAAGSFYLTIGYALRHKNSVWRIEIVERTRNPDASDLSAAQSSKLKKQELSQRRRIETAFRSVLESFRFDN